MLRWLAPVLRCWARKRILRMPDQKRSFWIGEEWSDISRIILTASKAAVELNFGEIFPSKNVQVSGWLSRKAREEDSAVGHVGREQPVIFENLFAGGEATMSDGKSLCGKTQTQALVGTWLDGTSERWLCVELALIRAKDLNLG